jgi:outer membrane protein
MKRRLLALAVSLCLAAPAAAEDLMDIYREAQLNDPTIAAARANWLATQERLPQARAGLLPQVGANASAIVNDAHANTRTDPAIRTNAGFLSSGVSISASQPIFRVANVVAFDQAKQLVEQSDYTLATFQQDLIIRVAVAYFDALLGMINVELAETQKTAVSESLAQARRNFEVGVATITDTNEAQAKYDSIVAAEIQARNELDNRLTALRAIIGRQPRDLRRLGPGFDPSLPEPNAADYWVERALTDNLSVRIARFNLDIATLEIDRQRAGHLPTLDLTGTIGLSAASGSPTLDASSYGRSAGIGFALNVPIYTGGFVTSKVREAVALQQSSREALEVQRRNALFNAQTGFTGVNSSVAAIRAFGQAVQSAEVAVQSNRLGQEVGVRTTLDVLNVQQNLFTARRDLANAYFQYLVNTLRLKSAVGALTEQDLEEINRRLRG